MLTLVESRSSTNTASNEKHLTGTVVKNGDTRVHQQQQMVLIQTQGIRDYTPRQRTSLWNYYHRELQW